MLYWLFWIKKFRQVQHKLRCITELVWIDGDNSCKLLVTTQKKSLVSFELERHPVIFKHSCLWICCSTTLVYLLFFLRSKTLTFKYLLSHFSNSLRKAFKVRKNQVRLAFTYKYLFSLQKISKKNKFKRKINLQLLFIGNILCGLVPRLHPFTYFHSICSHLEIHKLKNFVRHPKFETYRRRSIHDFYSSRPPVRICLRIYSYLEILWLVFEVNESKFIVTCFNKMVIVQGYAGKNVCVPSDFV
jgi:hypothetical protein